MSVVYRLFMEGDFGQDGYVFTTKEAAKDMAKTLYEAQDMEDPFEEFWEEMCGTPDLLLNGPNPDQDQLDLLLALESAGVDNWDGYSFALEELEGIRNEKEA